MIDCIHGTRFYEKVGISDKFKRIANFHFHFVSGLVSFAWFLKLA